mgnify:CR=1 FL=1
MRITMLSAFFLGILTCIGTEKRPNVIIIFTDDQGSVDLNCYGSTDLTTPHMDSLAKKGVRFTQFYAAAPVCSPSRAGLLTGRHPVRAGMPSNAGSIKGRAGLAPEEVTIAETFKAAGYVTAHIGKWHLGHLKKYMPLNHGFDFFYGIPYSNDMRPESKWDYARENFPPLPFLDGFDTLGVSLDQSNFIKMFTKKSIEFIHKNKNQPFFLYLAHTAPHTPLMLSEENKGLSARGSYGDVVEEIDRSVGEILNTLKKLNIAQNTLVLFTSDNGPWGWANIDGGSSGLLKGNKGSVYEGGYRVPAVAWMPKSIPRVTSTALATTLDLFPTILSQVDKDFEFKSIDGFDITKTLFENSPVRTDVHFYRQDTLIALRHKEWKLFIKDPNPWDDGPKQKDMPLLYNIEHDPSEKYDLAKDNPEIVQKLNILCQDHINSTYKAPSKYEAILPAYQSAYDENNKK